MMTRAIVVDDPRHIMPQEQPELARWLRKWPLRNRKRAAFQVRFFPAGRLPPGRGPEGLALYPDLEKPPAAGFECDPGAALPGP